MKKYTKPSIETTALTIKDILAASEVLIDGSGLFGDTTDGE